MSKVAIVIDSTTNLPLDVMKQYDIREIHSVVIWSGEELLDRVDIQPTEFYQRLSTAAEMPTTSQATPGEAKEVLEQLASEGVKDVLAIHLSDKLSGTIGSMEQAIALKEADINVEIVNTKSASMGSGWPILMAARAAEAGKSMAEVKAVAEAACQHTGLILVVDTLEFLHRGGRIGGAQRFIGTALNLKPILEVQDGAIEALERQRTTKKAYNRLVELTEERIGGRSPVYLAVLHANAADDAQKVLDMVAAKVNPVETIIAEVSPSVGTHTGPGTVGVAFMAGYEG
ncbi:MAG: DegV family protein [Chloroflexi bacterium]|nr:MAG: DegV family protein [Chloroflexota bacterium]MBL1196210.1 DegV family protein [Chloroflexota bacterium]NOH13503.1 DegV family protein [Chloroflexota bacterium]